MTAIAPDDAATTTGPATSWVSLSGGRLPASTQPPVSAARIVVQFVMASFVVVLVLIVGGLVVSRELARREALADARSSTDLLATTVIEPALTRPLLAGDPQAQAALTSVLEQRVLNDALVRIKIWTPSGRIVYSDEPRLIGSTYPLGAEERAALANHSTNAELSDASRPENRFETGLGPLLEVYRPVASTSGEPLLFETYSRYDVVAARGSSLWRTFAPIIVGVAVLLLLVQVPLAWWMVRRLRESQADREVLLRRALDASDDERRRIAGNLHDGVVQDLAGASLALSGAAEAAARDADSSAPLLRQAAAAVREAIGGLRSVLFEIYPPNLRSTGLTSALSDLAAPMAARGLQVDVRVAANVTMSDAGEALLFRVAQEGLRNVVKHARATRVVIDVRQRSDGVVMTMHDNGVGCDPRAVVSAPEPGHVGLPWLGDLAASAGAQLALASAPGDGTTLRLTVPTGRTSLAAAVT
jgi:two-component system, NarL family, sensor kinase